MINNKFYVLPLCLLLSSSVFCTNEELKNVELGPNKEEVTTGDSFVSSNQGTPKSLDSDDLKIKNQGDFSGQSGKALDYYPCCVSCNAYCPGQLYEPCYKKNQCYACDGGSGICLCGVHIFACIPFTIACLFKMTCAKCGCKS